MALVKIKLVYLSLDMNGIKLDMAQQKQFFMKNVGFEYGAIDSFSFHPRN